MLDWELRKGVRSGGYINKKREGRGIKYRINPDLSLRHDTHGEIAVGDFLEALGWQRIRRKVATPKPTGEEPRGGA